MGNDSKLFRDPVHGYIEVPNELCRRYIDTEVFQRLRFIEQSSMRMLFPAARHDRFIHSLGVYSIAKRVYNTLEPRFRESFNDKNLLRTFRETFGLAALLHDCAHSPFSHTGEYLAHKYCGSQIERELIELVGSDSFKKDFYSNVHDSHYATHELASAYVGRKRFDNVFGEFIDREQFVRMITGIKNKDCKSLQNGAFNCLISMLNGFIVDVDRLDYLQRDTWATGICNASVDIDRLIKGIDVDIARGRVKIKHTALASFINAVSARDYIFRWVIPHHVVSYANEILVRAIEHLISALVSDSESEVVVGTKLFSPKRLLEGGEVDVNGERIYMPTDGDLLYLMKKYIPNDEYFTAYCRRDKAHFSLWKTHAEFIALFRTKIEPRQEDVFSNADFWEMFGDRLNAYMQEHPFCICTRPSEIKCMHHKISQVQVDIEDSYSSGVLGSPNLDLTYMFGENARVKHYYFNAFVSASAIEAEHNKAEATIKELQELLLATIEEFEN